MLEQGCVMQKQGMAGRCMVDGAGTRRGAA